MEEKKDKRVLSIELDENVKKVSITGTGSDEQVVMRQELSEEELDQATGGNPNTYEFIDTPPALYSDDEEDIIIFQEPFRGKCAP